MSKDIRVQTRNRKRKVDFDTSRNLIPMSPKQIRKNSNSKNMNNQESQIKDLSATIMSNRPSSSKNIPMETGVRATSANSSIVSEEITPEVRDLVVDEALSVQKSLQDQVRNMVQVEIRDIKKSIENLMGVVENLSQLTTQNNKKLEILQNSSKFVSNEPQIIEVTQINPPSVELNAMPTTNQYRNNPTLPELSQNRTPSGNSNIPVPPIRNAYSNVPTNCPNITQNNTNFLQNNNRNNLPFQTNFNTEDMPAVYTFGDYHPTNTPITPNVPQKDMQPRMWIRIDKWGLNFDGRNLHMTVEDFIFRVERLQNQYEIPREELERDFHLLLSGPAKEWYWLFMQTHFGVKWPGLKQALLSQFQTTQSNFEILRDLMERKPNSNETIDDFFHSMSRIRAKLVQAIPEYDMIKILKRNVRETVGRIVYPISVSSVEQLRIECNEAERNFPRRETRNLPIPSRPTRQVNELYSDQNECSIMDIEDRSEEITELSAIQLNQQKHNVVCWNCKVPGHVFMECPSNERTLFCYRFGKPNVITPNCPHCQGNLKRGVGVMGDLRPQKNPNKEN